MIEPPETGAETALPAEFRSRLDRVCPVRREAALKSLHSLHAHGITSFDQLAAALPSLRDDALVAAIWGLRYFDARRTVPLLLRQLDSPDPSLRGYALIGLDMIGGFRAARAFVRHLLGDPDSWVREKAAHGLGFLFNSRFHDLAFEPLLSALENEDECPAVRAQAAEGLGNVLGSYSDKRVQRYKRAQQALIRSLDHPAPEIRFWAAFALGTMRSRTALPRLRQLAESDGTSVPLWWTVGEEASDAVTHILTGDWAEREARRSV